MLANIRPRDVSFMPNDPEINGALESFSYSKGKQIHVKNELKVNKHVPQIGHPI
jgi:hypothetical protein